MNFTNLYAFLILSKLHKSLNLLAVVPDCFLKHIVRSCPDVIFIIKTSVNNQLFAAFCVFCKADYLVLAAFEVAVFSERNFFLFNSLLFSIGAVFVSASVLSLKLPSFTTRILVE